MAKEKPWYYAVLPATIRYAEDLTELQKLLYAEITALAQANGYCYASNSYFANLYKKTSKWISSTIQDMAKKGYLEVKQNKEWWRNREIYIGEIKNIRKSLKIPANPIPLKTDSQFFKSVNFSQIYAIAKSGLSFITLWEILWKILLLVSFFIKSIASCLFCIRIRGS